MRSLPGSYESCKQITQLLNHPLVCVCVLRTLNIRSILKSFKCTKFMCNKFQVNSVVDSINLLQVCLLGVSPSELQN